MKRDMALILRILRCLRSRGDDTDTGFSPAPDYEPEVSEKRVMYHLDLCVQAGFLEHHPPPSVNRGGPSAWRLTWQGHDWIEAQSDC